MRFIEKPNLPQGKVKAALISIIADNEIICSLKAHGVEPILVPPCADIQNPVSAHPDMLFHHLGGNNIVCYRNADKKILERLITLGFNITLSEKLLRPDYPSDIALNAARISKNLYCLENTLDLSIKKYCSDNGVHIINVNQGYSKCSVCVVDDNSIITADKSIYEKAIENGVDVLLISSGNIELFGYNTGFIGGCCGKLSKNEIMFCGNIKLHPDFEKIKNFLDNRKIKIITLSNNKLTDYGSIIPLIEE